MSPRMSSDKSVQDLIVQLAENLALSFTAPPAQGSTAQDTKALGVRTSDVAHDGYFHPWVLITPTTHENLTDQMQ